MNNEQTELILTAICSNDLNLIKEFVSKNNNLINDITTFGTMLQIASREGNIDIVQYLIKKGANINIGGGFANSPIVDAIVQDHFNIVKLLCSNGAILDTKTFANNALFTAIAARHVEISKYLIDHGIDLTATYHIGEIENCDAMEYARQYGLTEVYDYIKAKLEK